MPEIIHHTNSEDVVNLIPVAIPRFIFRARILGPILKNLAFSTAGIFLMQQGYQEQINFNKIIAGAVYEQCQGQEILERLSCKRELEDRFWNRRIVYEMGDIGSMIVGGIAIGIGSLRLAGLHKKIDKS